MVDSFFLLCLVQFLKNPCTIFCKKYMYYNFKRMKRPFSLKMYLFTFNRFNYFDFENSIKIHQTVKDSFSSKIYYWVFPRFYYVLVTPRKDNLEICRVIIRIKFAYIGITKIIK